MPKANVEPCLFVVMGGRGDLMRRKLLPALYHLVAQNLLPKPFVILAAGRRSDIDDARFRDEARKALGDAATSGAESPSKWCDECLHYQPVGKETLEDYKALGARIAKLEESYHLPGNRVFYLALPPEAFAPTISNLGEAGLNRSSGWTRLVVEKPFGRDLESAQELNGIVHRYFEESQTYRIDHYLGKETVQNLLVFRFANPIFETLWNRDRIDNVQITVAETVGLEGRADYYEEAGVVRDMVQNHLTQLLAVMAMEVPGAFQAEQIRNEKVKVLNSISAINEKNMVLGQYQGGLLEGTQVPGYREEPDVKPDSNTPTFTALRLDVSNWRWHGVPFYLRTGKRLKKRITEIAVVFRCAPVLLFQPFDECYVHSNVLLITIQPDEGFDLRFEVKVPGQGIMLDRQSLHFRYAEVFDQIPEAYETLLLDLLLGDQTLFVRSDLVESSWRLYDPLIEKPPEIQFYASGTWGPAAADELLERHGHHWFSQ